MVCISTRQDWRSFACGEDFNKKHRAAAMNQEMKIIAPSKNTFQNMGALQNYFLKKCISKLLSKICVLNKRDSHRWLLVKKDSHR